MSKTCTACGQQIQEAHKEVLNKMKLTMLQTAAQHVKQTMKNDFKVYEFAPETQFKTYHNFQKLRYHGLITPVRENNQRIRGRWLITRNGWAFLRGELSLPSYVLVKNNRIEQHSEHLISVKDVYRGSEAITTTFEYFDEFGEPIGYRPTLQHNPQLSLV
jgi:hypothetical protein